MITSIFQSKNGDKFGFSCPEEIIPKWNEKTRHLTNKKFKDKCLLLLCIQKYHFQYIDKNVFFLMIQKMREGNYHFLPNKKFHEFLYYIKEIEIEKFIIK